MARTIRIKLPAFHEVFFSIKCEPEELQVRGNISAIDPITDKENEEYVLDQLERGNTWAWCSVEVIANYKGITAHDILGGCSYASEEDFTANDGYYMDMKRTAFNRLIDKIEALK